MHRSSGPTPATDPALEYIIAALTDGQHEGFPDDEAPVTPPITPTTSTTHEFRTRARAPLWVEIVAIPIGLAIVAGFGWCLWYEMRSPPTHTTHIAIFTGGVSLGLLVAFGRWFLFPVISQTLVIVAPYIPMMGGRRAGDPPAPPTP